MKTWAILCAGTLAGCASTAGSVRDAVSSAPDWYGERRNEILGKGYPDISVVPDASGDGPSARALLADRRKVARSGRAFEIALPPLPEALDIDTITAWAAGQRALFEAADTPARHLTDGEVRALKAQAVPPRAAS